MQSGAAIPKAVPATTDRELLTAIHDGLKSLYADILQQPIPFAIANTLMRLERTEQATANSCRRVHLYSEARA